jgi:hypothetical protein
VRNLILSVLIIAFYVSAAAASDATTINKPIRTSVETATPPPSSESTPEGATWRSIVGEKFIANTGMQVDFILDPGVSVNNSNNPSSGGAQNWPNGEPGDQGFQLSGLWTFIHRDMKANLLPYITPLPPPMYKNFDWGYTAYLAYGRDGQPCRMAGWDAHWGVNEPGASTPSYAAANRENFLCNAFSYGSIYLPILKGVTIIGGRHPDAMGFEIPINPTHGPNFFYSHTYAFYSETWQALGFLASANVFHDNLKKGYLVAEFGLNNGEQTSTSPSGHTMESFEAALRWKSPHMDTGVSYSAVGGYANVKTGTNGQPVSNTDFGPIYSVLSPVGEMRLRQDVVITHDFNRHWNAAAEAVYFSQNGGKQASLSMPYSLALGIPGSFAGAHAAGINGRVVYIANPKLSAGIRLETFHDPTGFWTLPLNIHVINGSPTVSKGYFNDFTAGVNYSPVKYVTIRPEIRGDWNNSGAFGTGTSSVMNATSKPRTGQLSWNMDMLVRF